MDRPTALDLAFLDLETPRAPLHVGWTMRFAGRAPSLAALRRHVDARLDSVPRFRRRLARAPLGLGDLHWIDHAGFDIAHHVHQVTLPAPGGPAELRETASAVLSQPLPMDRPLWRMYLVDGPGDGFAVVGQVHHVLVDGIAAVEVALLMFDAAGSPPIHAAPSRWTPQQAPSLQALATRATARRLRGAAGIAEGLARSVATGRVLGATREATEAIERVSTPAPTTALDRSVTAERVVAFADVPLQAVKDTGTRHGATINDVLLSAATLALRSALERRHERPSSAKVLVPVSVREPGEEGGNRISFLSVELPLSEPDPVRILRLVRARTRMAKSGGESGSLAALSDAADLLPAASRKLLTRTAVRAASFNAVVSNVPGPPVDLLLLGRKMVAIHPMVPILDGHGLTIGALSYNGRLQLGLAADAAVVPDAVDVARDLERAFDVLRLAMPKAAPPWRTQARARRDGLRLISGGRSQPAATKR